MLRIPSFHCIAPVSYLNARGIVYDFTLCLLNRLPLHPAETPLLQPPEVQLRSVGTTYN